MSFAPTRVLHLATTNMGKQRELSLLLSPLGWSLQMPPAGWEVVEDGETFAANASKKALALQAQVGGYTLADDSGLMVDALDGAPGVYSARFAGHPGPAAARDVANCAHLLAELAAHPLAPRTARLICTLAWAAPGAAMQLFVGTLHGEIAIQPRGSAGFGYDPLFIPAGSTQTLAQLGTATKNAIGHRGRALAQLLGALAT